MPIGSYLIPNKTHFVFATSMNSGTIFLFIESRKFVMPLFDVIYIKYCKTYIDLNYEEFISDFYHLIRLV